MFKTKEIIPGYSLLIMLICFFLISSVPAQTPPQGGDKWIEAIKASMGMPGMEDPGLLNLVKAFENFNSLEVMKSTKTLDEIRKNGWRKPYPEIESLLVSQKTALEYAYACGAGPKVQFPDLGANIRSPFPNFLAVEGFIKLMNANARRYESQGDLPGAIQRLILTARFTNQFSSENAYLIQQLISLSGVSTSLETLQEVLRNPSITPQIAQKTGADLFELEKGVEKGMVNGMKGEGRIFVEGFKKALEEKGKLTPPFDRAGNPQEVIQKIEQVWSEQVNLVEKPYWEIRKEDSSKISDMAKSIHQSFTIPNFMECKTRHTIMMARLRLCMTLCALKMNKPDLAATFQDPFTGKPLSIAADRIYSFGPDKADQKGQLDYNPKNGTVSPGDIFVMK
ncbi:hypothetical protein JW926_01820 [Candidatus Sumerlaeota bacterium]|nr:hypothetical protein [Candidatus Sumerlaeota bacterium]